MKQYTKEDVTDAIINFYKAHPTIEPLLVDLLNKAFGDCSNATFKSHIFPNTEEVFDDVFRHCSPHTVVSHIGNYRSTDDWFYLDDDGDCYSFNELKYKQVGFKVHCPFVFQDLGEWLYENWSTEKLNKTFHTNFVSCEIKESLAYTCWNCVVHIGDIILHKEIITTPQQVNLYIIKQYSVEENVTRCWTSTESISNEKLLEFTKVNTCKLLSGNHIGKIDIPATI